MTLLERLSRLTCKQAEKLLGPKGPKLIIAGGKYTIDISSQVEMSNNVFRLSMNDATVSIVEDDKSVNKMRLICSACDAACEHMGAAFSLILEEKMSLNLATPPTDTDEPLELTETELINRELMRRTDRATSERFTLKSTDQRRVWTDYVVTSRESGKSYRIALRGWERGQSYCSCPDFRKNTLGTCKHILHTTARVRAMFPSWKKTAPFVPALIEVHLAYGADVELRVQLPPNPNPVAAKTLSSFINKAISDITGLLKAIATCTGQGVDIIVYPDAEQYIDLHMHRERIASLTAEMQRAPARHPLRSTLLKVELLPYQLEGIGFAVGMGRAILADDMGLGKTIQGIGMAELLARECAISRVLIVCPASVKGQWRNEIGRFSERSSAIVAGGAADRFAHYQSGAFFTICNYEQVLRDLQAIEKVRWDLIILDEGQRIKNWEAKTSRTIKALRSPYALVLSGTPLENRLEELYSVMEFIDDRRLGPDFRFEHRHRVGDGRGRVLGYKNLDVLRTMLRPALLRRTRDAVMKQLPPRTTEIVRVTPTEEQMDIHVANMKIITQIVHKAFLTEMDLLRLQKSLLACRMAADSTVLVNKEEPGYSTKLERLAELLPMLAAEAGRKVILFSEWTTMLSLIEKTILKKNTIEYVRLDGSVPQGKRQLLVNRFQNDPTCTFFIATNAGATGLNLHAANTVVNVDLPWNPAVLEQRIGRAHRMGQKRPVQVYLLVSENTIEENMLKTLAAKKDLSLAALDAGSDVTAVDMKTGIDELKRRLEVLLAQKPAAEIDESEQRRVETEARRLGRQKNLEQAGGTLLGAAFAFMKAALPIQPEPTADLVRQVSNGLSECLQQEPDGTVSMKLRLPSTAAVEELAKTLAVFAQMATVKN
jgi:superfamily II DNA or RNA helicase